MRICYLLEINNVHSQRWIKYFKSLGHEILVLTDFPPRDEIPGIRIINPKMNLTTKILAFKLYPKPFGNESFKWIPYKKEIKRFKPDIIHAMEATAYGFALAMSGKYKKILTPWGNDIFYDPFRSKIAHYLILKGLCSADIITSNHPHLDEYLSQTFNIDKSKVFGFSWGIDLSIFNPNKTDEAGQARKELCIPEKTPVIISNRSFSEYWGAGIIMEAIPLVLKAIPEARFIIIRGSGDEVFLNSQIEVLKKIGCLDKVIFINERLSPQKMSVLLNLADAFISVPFTDMLSLSVIEGMACGAVPIISDLSAYKTKIIDGKNGFIVPVRNSQILSEKIIYTMKHPEIKKQFSEYNWESVRREDDWEKCKTKMSDLYDMLIKSKKDCH